MTLRFQRARHRLSLMAWGLVLCLASGSPAVAEATPDDPVVADVVRMLDAGLEPQLILGWIESGNKRPATLSASDMIALATAEAPPELIEELLARAARPAKAERAPHEAQPATDPLQHDASQPASAPVTAGECCLVDFSVEYRAPEQSNPEQSDTPRAELYLYLDGQFLGRYAPRSEIADKGPKPTSTELRRASTRSA